MEVFMQIHKSPSDFSFIQEAIPKKTELSKPGIKDDKMIRELGIPSKIGAFIKSFKSEAAPIKDPTTAEKDMKGKIETLNKNLKSMSESIKGQKENIKSQEEGPARQNSMDELVKLRKEWNVAKKYCKELRKELGPSLFFRSKELKELKNLEKTISKEFKEFTQNFKGAGRMELDDVEDKMTNLNMLILSVGLEDPDSSALQKAIETMSDARTTITGLKETHSKDPDFDKKAAKLDKTAEKFINKHTPTLMKLQKKERQAKESNDVELEMKSLNPSGSVRIQSTNNAKEPNVKEQLDTIKQTIRVAYKNYGFARSGLEGDKKTSKNTGNETMNSVLTELATIKADNSKDTAILKTVNELELKAAEFLKLK
jgi:hypothetical protein